MTLKTIKELLQNKSDYDCYKSENYPIYNITINEIDEYIILNFDNEKTTKPLKVSKLLELNWNNYDLAFKCAGDEYEDFWYSSIEDIYIDEECKAIYFRD